MGSSQINVNKASQDVLRDGLIYDVQTRGLDAVFWKTLAATLSVASNKIRMASGGEIVSYTQFKHGRFQFALNVPTTPSAGEAKKWGLLNPGSATTGAMYFEITGATFRAVSYDNGGTVQTTTLTWGGEATEQVFEIEWGEDFVIFKRAGTAVATHQTRVGTVPLPLYLINSDADNTDLGYIFAFDLGFKVTGGGSSSSGGGLGSSINIGDVQEDAASTSVSGTVTATTPALTTVRAADANRHILDLQNAGANRVHFGAGTVTTSFPYMEPGGTAVFRSQEACVVLTAASTSAVNFTDYINS